MNKFGFTACRRLLLFFHGRPHKRPQTEQAKMYYATYSPISGLSHKRPDANVRART